MSLFQLTGFQRDLMYVTAALDRPSGQEIKDRLEEELGVETTHGRLYPNLDTLVNKGFVERGEIDRRTNYYVLSDAGRQALLERREWESRFFELGDE
ncbi:PadR family transcriptional regulator [Salinigranum rubrum]|uniref:PadR family transcriptional regulator n=1 Tax=Salinigranum rubrum TaxID=755307 RepID=A0A2I8VG45_9EURY|nr:helix-turn-helix transcriptional regulator [Salinigranum rubrum]AUV80903.1 PadR family transcriptional regulator [Salinigranum rubrum]